MKPQAPQVVKLILAVVTLLMPQFALPANALTNTDIAAYTQRTSQMRDGITHQAKVLIEKLDSTDGAKWPPEFRLQGYVKAALMLMNVGEWRNAEHPLQKALELNRGSMQTQMTSLGISGNLVKVYFSQSKINEAEQLLEEMRPYIDRMPDKHDLQGIGYQLLKAELFLAKGNAQKFDEVLAEIMKVVSSRYQLKGDQNSIVVNRQIMELHAKSGNLREALILLNKADAESTSGTASHNLDEIWARKLAIAKLLNAIGDREASIRILMPAENIAGLSPAILANVHLNLGAYLKQNRSLSRALRHFSVSAQLSENLNSPTNINAPAYLNIAMIYIERDDFISCEINILKAVDSLNRNPGVNPTALQRSFKDIALLLHKIGKDSLAKEYLQKAIALSKHNALSGAAADYSENILLMDILRKEKDLNGLVEMESRIFKSIEDKRFARRLEGSAKVQNDKAVDAYYDLYLHDSDKYFERSLAYAQIIGVPSIEHIYINAIQRNNIADTRVKELVRQKEYLQYQLSHATLSSQSDNELARGIQEKLWKTESEIRVIHPEYGEFVEKRQSSVKDIQHSLKLNQAMIMYLPSTEAYYAWIVTSSSSKMIRLMGTPKEIRKLVKKLRSSLELSAGGQLADYEFGAAHELYMRLVEPLTGALNGVKHIYLIPDATLLAVPFPALVMDKRSGVGHQWLASQYAVSVLPSPRTLVYLRKAKPVSAPKPFAAFGDPVLGSGTSSYRTSSSHLNGIGTSDDLRRLSKLPSLPDTRTEILSIAKTLNAGSDGIYLGPIATEANVKTARLSQFKVIAFATHGVSGGEIDGIAEPGLVLTPPQNPSDVDDGVLTASEILSLKLDADWVILSACNTAAGDGRENVSEDLTGLAQSFMFVGARSLLVSNWPVESAAASQLTTKTIQKMSAAPSVGKAEALRLTMLQMSKDEKWGHPFYWAPFSLIGAGD